MTYQTTKPASGRKRAERLEARVTAEQKQLIEHRDHQRLEFTFEDRVAFVDALLHPKPINERLRDTVRRYREAAGV